MSIEAMKQALEALESSRVFVTTREKIKHPEGTEWYDERITAIRTAIEQAEKQEPVGEVVQIDPADDEDGPHAWVALYNDVALGTKFYTTPPAAPVQEIWNPTDTAYRPGGLPQDFIKHEVENEGDWSEWVNPKHEQYFMKCCDCGLVHEMQFKVAKYAEGDECEFVEDADTQAVFRARRASPTKREWVGLSEEEIDKLKHLIDWTATWSHGRFAYEIEQLLKEKNA